ncbi:MAG: flagellar basal body P-ring formation chaperone FlgA [Alphaproteobacteria bacterium]|nr:flagellar basal body P-ring formation chaperone FlgA [Alphaproteobacteria bacterium]
MKRIEKIIMTAAAFGVLMCASTLAFAANLKSASAVTEDIITVGDVFDGTGEYADRYLGPAPAPGRTMTLSQNDLYRISNAFDLGWQATATENHLVIRRIANTLSQDTIADALKQAVRKKMPGQKLGIDIDSRIKNINLPADTAKTVSVSNLEIDAQRNRFTAKISAPADAPVVHRQVSGRISIMTDVPVLTSALREGDIISSNDITTIEMDARKVPANIVLDAQKLVGQTPRRGLAAMRPLTPSEIMAPLSVKKGDLVTVILKNGALNLTMQAKALQNGADGEVVRLINTESNRMLEGTITGPQTVTMTLTSAKL